MTFGHLRASYLFNVIGYDRRINEATLKDTNKGQAGEQLPNRNDL